MGPGGGGDEDILVIRKHNRVIMNLNISCEDREGKRRSKMYMWHPIQKKTEKGCTCDMFGR